MQDESIERRRGDESVLELCLGKIPPKRDEQVVELVLASQIHHFINKISRKRSHLQRSPHNFVNEMGMATNDQHQCCYQMLL